MFHTTVYICFITVYRQLGLCVCTSDDNSKENTEGKRLVSEEEVVIVQFVSCDLNKMHVILFFS